MTKKGKGYAPAYLMREEFNKNIRESGRQIIGVFPSESGDHAFGYTIGNSLKGYPELLLIGWCDEAMQGILDTLSEKMIERGHAFTDGELVDVGGKYALKIIACREEAKDEYTIQAGVYYGSKAYDVMQVVIPDPQGKFPGEAECQEPLASLPVMRRLAS